MWCDLHICHAFFHDSRHGNVHNLLRDSVLGTLHRHKPNRLHDVLPHPRRNEIHHLLHDNVLNVGLRNVSQTWECHTLKPCPKCWLRRNFKTGQRIENLGQYQSCAPFWGIRDPKQTGASERNTGVFVRPGFFLVPVELLPSALSYPLLRVPRMKPPTFYRTHTPPTTSPTPAFLSSPTPSSTPECDVALWLSSSTPVVAQSFKRSLSAGIDRCLERVFRVFCVYVPHLHGTAAIQQTRSAVTLSVAMRGTVCTMTPQQRVYAGMAQICKQDHVAKHGVMNGQQPAPQTS